MLLAAGWTAFAVLGQSWWQMMVAVFLEVMFTQIGFIGHDAGHRQISGSKRADTTGRATDPEPAADAAVRPDATPEPGIA